MARGEQGANLDAYAVARFWAKVDVRRPGECWEWLAARNEHGYGIFRLPNGQGGVRAHRMAWRLMLGAWPTINLLHSCDNPRCVNPRHLSEGTQLENIADMVSKGRNRGIRHSRLTVEQIDDIKKSSVGQSILGEKYGVSASYISMIRGGKRLTKGTTHVG